MIIAQIDLKKTTPEQLLKSYREGLVQFSKKERDGLLQLLKTAVSNGDFVLSLNVAVLGLLFFPEDTGVAVRRKGIFRYSVYIGRKCIVKELAAALLKFAGDAEILDDASKQYLRSVIRFSFVSREYARLKQLILKEFQTFYRSYKRESLLKTMLVYADLQFFIGKPQDPAVKEDHGLN